MDIRLPPERSRSAVPPDKAFLLIGLTFGVLFVFIVPPFQVPDEPLHFYRAFQVSELRLLPVVVLRDQKYNSSHHGALLPKSLAALVDSSEVTTTRFRLAAKASPSKLLATLRTPLEAGSREHLPVAFYPPIGHLPQAAGIGMGRLLGLPPLVLFYLGRLGALGAWVGLVSLAIRTTPLLKWTYVLLALMPMTLHLAASHSVDGVVIGASFLLTAQLLCWAYDERKERIGWRDCVWLFVLAGTLTLSKAAYLLLMSLFFLVPRRKFESKTAYYLSFVTIVIACLAAYFAWTQLTLWFATPGPTVDLSRHGVDFWASDVSPRRQLEFILSHPSAFMGVLATTLQTFGRGYVVTFVGALGWLDTRLPVWMPYVYVLVLIAASLLDGSRERVRWRAKCLSFGIAAFGSLGLLVLVYMGVNAVGAVSVEGLQGRYLIPIAPTFFLLFHTSRARWRVTNVAALALIGFVVLTMSVATYRLVERFYVVGVPSYSIR